MNPLNGQVTFSSTVFNSFASYSCASGFTLDGLNIRTCLASGSWSGVEPTCQGK